MLAAGVLQRSGQEIAVDDRLRKTDFGSLLKYINWRRR